MFDFLTDHLFFSLAECIVHLKYEAIGNKSTSVDTSCIKQWNNKSSRWGFVFFFLLTDSGQPYPWIETHFLFYFSQHCNCIKCDRKWILCYLGWVFVVWHGMLHFLDWNVKQDWHWLLGTNLKLRRPQKNCKILAQSSQSSKTMSSNLDFV